MMSRAAARTSAWALRSATTTSALTPASAEMDSASSRPRTLQRTTNTRSAPCAARPRAMAVPMPCVAPAQARVRRPREATRQSGAAKPPSAAWGNASARAPVTTAVRPASGFACASMALEAARAGREARASSGAELAVLLGGQTSALPTCVCP
jgi:hypothetical protein